MKSALKAWEADILPRVLTHTIMLFLDYDGTLTPIVEHPEDAHLSTPFRRVLHHLTKHPAVKICIISGRELEDLKKRVKIPGILYVGNHGFEIEGPKIKHVHPDVPKYQKILSALVRNLKQDLKAYPGIYIENKKWTLSIHYRKLSPALVGAAKMWVLREAAPYLESSEVTFHEGKKVWEFRPSLMWNKGTTVLWLLGRQTAAEAKKVLPIYLGDDLTDEDGFNAVKNRGIGIKIEGEHLETRASAARFFLASPHETLKFLRLLLKSKLNGKSEHGNE